MFLTWPFVSIFRSTLRVALKTGTAAKKGNRRNKSTKAQPAKKESNDSCDGDKKINSNSTDAEPDASTTQEENSTPAVKKDHDSTQSNKAEPAENETDDSHEGDKKSNSNTTDAEPNNEPDASTSQEENRTPAVKRDHDSTQSKEQAKDEGDKQRKKKHTGTPINNEPVAVILSQGSILPEARSSLIGSTSIAAELLSRVAQQYPLAKLASNEIVAEFSDENDTSGLGSEMMNTSTDSFVKNAIKEIDKTVEMSAPMRPEEYRLRDSTWKATDRNFSFLSNIEISDIDGDTVQVTKPTVMSVDDPSDLDEAQPLSRLQSRLRNSTPVSKEEPALMTEQLITLSVQQTAVSIVEQSRTEIAAGPGNLTPSTADSREEDEPTLPKMENMLPQESLGELKSVKSIMQSVSNAGNLVFCTTDSNEEDAILSEAEDSLTMEEIMNAPPVTTAEPIVETSTSATPSSKVVDNFTRNPARCKVVQNNSSISDPVVENATSATATTSSCKVVQVHNHSSITDHTAEPVVENLTSVTATTSSCKIVEMQNHSSITDPTAEPVVENLTSVTATTSSCKNVQAQNHSSMTDPTAVPIAENQMPSTQSGEVVEVQSDSSILSERRNVENR